MGKEKEQAEDVIANIRNCETVELTFADFHFFLITVERYRFKFDLNFITKISGDEITLKGVKDGPE